MVASPRIVEGLKELAASLVGGTLLKSATVVDTRHAAEKNLY